MHAPRRRSSHIPSYRRHKSSGQAVVTLNGTDHYLGPYGTKISEEKYKWLMSDYLSGASHIGASKTSITITEVFAAFIRHAKHYYRKNGSVTSEVHVFRQAIRFVDSNCGDIRVSEFGPVALRKLREQMIHKGWSRTYINRLVQKIRHIFRWAVAEEMIRPENYQALASLPGLRRDRSNARETLPVGPVSDHDVDKVLPHVPPRVADMIQVQLLTGMRPGEVCRLQIDEIDRTQTTWIYSPSNHKTSHLGKSRHIPIGPQARALIQKYLDQEATKYIFSPEVSVRLIREQRHHNRTTPQSCGNARGVKRDRGGLRGESGQRLPKDHYDVASYRRCINRACDLAGIDRWSPNQLRHAAATRLRARFGIEAARTVLGHTKIETTEIYAERDLRLATHVAEALG